MTKKHFLCSTDMRPFPFLSCVAPLDCLALITAALVFSLMNPLAWFVSFGVFVFFFVGLVFLFWGWWVGKISLDTMGKGTVNLCHGFGITGPSISAEHVQGV